MVNEPSPCAACQTLTTEWKVGTSLATALIDMYGGNLHMISNAMTALSCSAPVDFGARASVDITRCIVQSDEHQAEMVRVLTALVETGFAKVDPVVHDPVVELLAAHNVATFVSQTAVLEGVPNSVRMVEVCGIVMQAAGLVPVAQYMRLAIAQVLFHCRKANVLDDSPL